MNLQVAKKNLSRPADNHILPCQVLNISVNGAVIYHNLPPTQSAICPISLGVSVLAS